MRKFIMFLMVLFATIGLTGCFTEADTLEWKTLPKSVYDQKTDFSQADIEEFKKSVTIVVNGVELTLAQALSQYPYDMTFTGFDLRTSGQKTITIKFKTLSIYWAYVVGEPAISTVTPEYGWYGNGSASTFILNNVNDLYGFANIVNGKRPDHLADPFEGKTVKLGADIDLTGKIWEPIGAAPRKRNVPLKPLFDLTGLENLFIDNEKLFTGDTFNLTSTSDVVKTISDEANQIYFDVTKKGNDITISICNTYEKYGEIEENRRSFIPTIKKQELMDLVGTDADRLAALKARVITKLQDQITAGSIYDKYFIAPEIYAEAVSQATENSVSLNSIDYEFTYSGDIEQGKFFSGTFDGQGHKIIGLSDVGYTPTVVLTYANSSTIVTGYTFGLFGVVTGNAAVKNLTFEDVQVVGAYYDTTGENPKLVLAEIDSVGAAIGFAVGDGNLTLDNIKVLSGSITAQMSAGGIIGRFYNKGNTLIQNCENRANITLTNGGYHVGGIAGYGTINPDGTKTVVFRNNINYGNIITGKVNSAGAMIDYVGNGNKVENKPLFDNCRNFGNIYGSKTVNQTDQSWGLVGQKMSYHNYNNCVNYGTVTNELPQN